MVGERQFDLRVDALVGPLEVVSNAPSWKFHGAAGMTSGEVRKARSDLGQKRHTNPLDEGGASAPPAPVSVADAAAATACPFAGPADCDEIVASVEARTLNGEWTASPDAC